MSHEETVPQLESGRSPACKPPSPVPALPSSPACAVVTRITGGVGTPCTWQDVVTGLPVQHPQELPDSQLCCRVLLFCRKHSAFRALHLTGKSRVQTLSTKHGLLAFLLVPGSSLALGHPAQSMAEGGKAAGRAGQMCCVSHTGQVASVWSGGTTGAALGVHFLPPTLT